MSDSVIKVKNLKKLYRKSTGYAVDNISFEVKNGSFYAFLGPNGAGKSTTISILNTTLSKTSGEIHVAGFDIDKDQDMVRRSIGVVFQNPSLDLNLTAEENIRFHTNLYGLYTYRPSFKLMSSEYKDKMMSLCDLLEIKEKQLYQPIKSFSGGMKRKMEIIRGLIHKPKVLFLDEPTTGLDPISRKNLWKYLQKIRKEENITIFLTTHYLEEAEDADSVCIINNGRIVAKGTPLDLKKKLIENYLIINSKNTFALKSELEKMELKYTGSGPFKIEFDDKTNIHELLKSINTELNFIDIHNPSLEEAYIKIISSDNDNE